ncbi:MAG: TM2 domain-containing protein [Gemmatimonadota bacterium]
MDVDASLLNDLVAAYNEEQEQRRKAGLPPKDLAFMPPLHDEALEATPEWITRWEARSRGRQAIRLAGDLLVLYVAGDVLGRLSSVQGVPEAIVAVVFLALITVAGAGPEWLHELPIVKDFVRWSHQLRLFYYHNKPANPFSLLIRPVIGMISAPFRTRARAEVRMYAELGAVFTAIFLLLDIVQDILVPAVSPTASFQVSSVLGGWVKQGIVTFFAIYAFAAPIGAVLTLYLLTRPTHTVPRILAAWTLVAILLGVIR